MAPRSAALASDSAEEGIFKGLFRRLQNLIRYHTGTDSIVNLELSDVDTRKALEAALRASGQRWFWVFAVFSDTFVYEGESGTLIQRSYSIGEDGTITLGGELTQVRPEVTFVPVVVNPTEEARMASNKDKATALIASAVTRYTDEDRAWLEGLDEKVLDKLEPIEAGPAPKDKPTKAPQGAEGASDKDPEGSGDKPDEEPKTPVSPEQYVAKAPPEVQEVLNAGLSLQREQRDGLVKALAANKSCEFTEDELRAMKMDVLKRVARLAQVPDYTGQGAPVASSASEMHAPAPPEMFPAKPNGAEQQKA
jgi:hypothetical protein